tara:strand:+ start:379 stop:1320 length:942 start_codon:yes stop_codon:yes gene_type:complete
MANTTSGTTTFDKTFSIDEIIEESYNRLGQFDMSGYNLKTARRSLNIMFQEWGNRGLHFWEVANTNITLETNKNEYRIFRATSDGNSDGVTSTLTAAITSTTATAGITIASKNRMPDSGTINVGSENISYTGFNSLELTGVTRGVNGTTAATHADGASITNFVNQATEILECSFRNNSNVDSPLEKINRSQYQALSNKTATGQPSQYFVQRFIDHVLITIYLTPSSTQNGDVINFYYEKRIQDAGAYSNATDVPYRFVPCMVAGLSYYLSMKYAQPRIQELKLIYEDELARALEEDGSSASVYISPKTYFPSI